MSRRTDDMIYLDNAATTYPKPMQVRKAAELFAAAGPESVIFTSGCTAAINQVVFGKLKPGDHAVISDLEHNSVVRPLHALSGKDISFTVAETFPEDDDRTVRSFESAMRENTKIVICTGASNVWGIRLPVKKIGEMVHRHGAEFCVDGAQAAGVVPLSLKSDGIDYLCLPGHKGLYGVTGTGMLISDKADSLIPLIYGGTGSNSRDPEQPESGPERFESGTVNVPGIIALGAGLDFVRNMGIDNLRRDELRKAADIYDFLKAAPQINLYTGRPRDPYYVPVVSFDVGKKGELTDRMAEYLAHQNISVRSGLHCAPSAHKKMGTENGAIRVAVSCFTTDRDIVGFKKAASGFIRGYH